MTALLVGLLGYLLLVSAAAAFVVLPGWRQGVLAWTRRRARGATRAVSQASRRTAHTGAGVAALPLRAIAHLRAWGPVQWAGVGALAVTLVAPALVAFWLGTDRWLDSYDGQDRHRVDPQIAALLQGEQLVPPAPLPPEVFSTREVEVERPMLASASREWGALDADFRQRLLLAFKLMRDKYGYDMALLEGYRSPERQALLYARGPQVTQAGPNQSYHQVGLAADCAFYRDGKLVISEKDAWALRGYQLYGQVAESVGLQWGGRWTTLADLGHVELRRPGALQALSHPQNH